MAQHPRVAAVFTEIRHWLVDRDDSAEPRIAQNLHKLYYLIFEQDLPVSVIPLQKWRKWQRRLMLTEEGRYNRVQPQEPIPVLMGLLEYYARKGSLYSKSNRDSTVWQDAQAEPFLAAIAGVYPPPGLRLPDRPHDNGHGYL